MDRNYRMIKTTIIYFVGSFGSKILAFFLLPLYTKYLSPEQFGNVDLILSIIPLIGPVFTLQTTESIFRFLFNCDTVQKKKVSITTAFLIYIIGMLGFIVLFIPYVIYSRFEHAVIFGAYFITMYLSIFAQQVLRGFQKNISYAITGIISTFVQAVINVLLIQKFQETALLIAPLVASIIVSIYAIYISELWRFISWKSVSKEELKKQLVYGIPLVPNQICWWFNGIVGKYIVNYYVGTSANGLLAVATRFPNLVSVIMQIYFLAWTENSIFEYASKDRDEYYSNNFNGLIVFLICAISGLLLIVKIYMSVMISSEYDNAMFMIPILMIAMLFNAVATFLGTIYTASMKTKDAFSTTIYAAGINILASFIFISKMGIYGYALANVISYFIFAIIRFRSANRIVEIYFEWRKMFIPGVFLTISLVAYYYCELRIICLVLVMEALAILFLGKKYIKVLLEKVRR